jgi:hypothetical protein
MADVREIGIAIESAIGRRRGNVSVKIEREMVRTARGTTNTSHAAAKNNSNDTNRNQNHDQVNPYPHSNTINTITTTTSFITLVQCRHRHPLIITTSPSTSVQGEQRDFNYGRPRSNPSLPTEVIDLNPSGQSNRLIVNVSPVLSRPTREGEGEGEGVRTTRKGT